MGNRDIAISGLVPVPDGIEAGSVVGLVEVEYSSSYRCAICGWTPRQSFGCIPAMKKHLEENHTHRLPEKQPWIAGFCNSQIKQALQDQSEPLSKAAPELLEACKEALDELVLHESDYGVRCKLEAAIAKADDQTDVEQEATT